MVPRRGLGQSPSIPLLSLVFLEPACANVCQDVVHGNPTAGAIRGSAGQ